MSIVCLNFDYFFKFVFIQPLVLMKLSLNCSIMVFGWSWYTASFFKALSTNRKYLMEFDIASMFSLIWSWQGWQTWDYCIFDCGWLKFKNFYSTMQTNTPLSSKTAKEFNYFMRISFCPYSRSKKVDNEFLWSEWIFWLRRDVWAESGSW